jgi:nitrogen fixation NifU-like protein
VSGRRGIQVPCQVRGWKGGGGSNPQPKETEQIASAAEPRYLGCDEITRLNHQGVRPPLTPRGAILHLHNELLLGLAIDVTYGLPAAERIETVMSDTYTLYNQTVMDHFMNPRNMGDLKEADGVGEVGAAACGDIMKISLKIKDGKIEDARFKTFGCGSAIASSSMATELIKGRSIEEAMNFSNQEVVDALGGLPPVKIHCSVLAEEALKAALEDYVKKHPELAKKQEAVGA